MNYAIILSGGTGTRLGLDIPKQYYAVDGKPIIKYVIDTITKTTSIDGVVIVASSEWHAYISDFVKGNDKFIGFAEPGKNRQLSIYHGLQMLQDIATEDDMVLIQDAARPNTSEVLIERCLNIAENEDGAMPVLPMKDTIYLSKDGKLVGALLPREQLFAGQAPESFRYGKYIRANEALLPEKILTINGSTEPAVLVGMKIMMVDGDEKNFKVTTQADLERFCKQVEGE